MNKPQYRIFIPFSVGTQSVEIHQETPKL